MIRVEYGPNTAMNCADGIWCHWRAKNAFSRSRFGGVPGREDGQRAEQADPRPGRAGLARRPVQPGQRVGARRGEHVLLAAQQPGDRGVIQVQPLDQAG